MSPRRIVQFEKNSYYHVYSRGADKRTICGNMTDYLCLASRFLLVAEKLDIRIISWALLPNHFHFLLCQNSNRTVNELIQRVLGSHAQRFNERHGRTGVLVESRFKAKVVSDPAYLSQLCLYIHGNPIKHGLVNEPGQWPYSNFHELSLDGYKAWRNKHGLAPVLPATLEEYAMLVKAYVHTRSDELESA